MELADGGGATSKIQRTEMRPCPTMSQTVPLGKNNSCHSSEGLPATSEGLSDTQSSSSLSLSSEEEEEEEFLAIAGPQVSPTLPDMATIPRHQSLSSVISSPTETLEEQEAAMCVFPSF